MKLYDYFRSTASYRTRIALNYKEVSHEVTHINLLKQEQSSDKYHSVNPQGLVPSLHTEDTTLHQSLGILEYLEERFPTPALLPTKRIDRAIVRGMALMVVADIHPLNNLRVLEYLTAAFDTSEDQKLNWYHHWICEGFSALESRLSSFSDGKTCFGETFTMADVCLIPQVYSASHVGVYMEEYPLIQSINNFCLDHDAFYKASPEYNKK